jgi:cold shock CspA family protein
MPTGAIKKLVADKGFGFILADDGQEVFFHHSVVADRQFDNLTEIQKGRVHDRARRQQQRQRAESEFREAALTAATSG